MTHRAPSRLFTARPLTLAVAAALVQIGAAHAQTAPAADASDGLKLDRVVITGTVTSLPKMQQSVSISSIDNEQL